MSDPVGSLSRMAFDSATPFDASSTWLEFSTESIETSQPVVNSDGVRGTRMAESGRNILSGRRVGGSITMPATITALNALLPFCLGAAESSNVFNVAESLPAFQALIDKIEDIYLYTNGKVGAFSLEGQQNSPVTLTLEVEFEDYTLGQSWPGTLTQPDRKKPFFFADGSPITLLSGSRDIFGFKIRVDNQLSADQYGTSLIRDGLLEPQNRIVTAEFVVKGNTTNKDLLTHTLDGEAVTLALVSANESGSECNVTLGRWHAEKVVPTIQGKAPVRKTLQGVSRGYLHPGETGHVPDISIEVLNA